MSGDTHYEIIKVTTFPNGGAHATTIAKVGEPWFYDSEGSLRIEETAVGWITEPGGYVLASQWIGEPGRHVVAKMEHM